MHQLKPAAEIIFGPGPVADKPTRAALRRAVEAAAQWEDLARVRAEYAQAVRECHTQAEYEAARNAHSDAQEALGILAVAYDRAHGIE